MRHPHKKSPSDPSSHKGTKDIPFRVTTQFQPFKQNDCTHSNTEPGSPIFYPVNGGIRPHLLKDRSVRKLRRELHANQTLRRSQSRQTLPVGQSLELLFSVIAFAVLKLHPLYFKISGTVNV